jgi:hypothetical protein
MEPRWIFGDESKTGSLRSIIRLDTRDEGRMRLEESHGALRGERRDCMGVFNGETSSVSSVHFFETDDTEVVPPSRTRQIPLITDG